MAEKLSPGNRVSIKTAEATYIGLVMPASELAPKDILILKLENGYNIGLSKSKIKSIEKLGEQKLGQFPSVKLKKKKALPTISIITTGGTITSRVDYKTGAVHALSKPEELLANIPELADIANLRVLNPFNVMSEDMTPKEWVEIAKIVAKELNKEEISGVIVTHGTDTLHFTSAALSFMLKGLNKPVAVVGGQRSSDRGSFDGAQNLICAAHYCLSDIAEVAIVMHGTTEDNYCLANLGTKTRKMHCSRRDTFRPINTLPLAKIWPDGKIEVLSKNFRKRSAGKVIADTEFESKVALVKFAPGLDPSVIDFYVKNKYKGIILEGTGLGHVAVRPRAKEASWLPAIDRSVKAGIFIGVAPQCLYGRLDPYVYANQRLMLGAGAVFLEDMLPETAYIKLGIALARAKSFKEIKKIMLTNLAGEISKRIEKQTFLY